MLGPVAVVAAAAGNSPQPHHDSSVEVNDLKVETSTKGGETQSANAHSQSNNTEQFIKFPGKKQ